MAKTDQDIGFGSLVYTHGRFNSSLQHVCKQLLSHEYNRYLQMNLIKNRMLFIKMTLTIFELYRWFKILFTNL